MTTITAKGAELFSYLYPAGYVGDTDAAIATCSLICRHAKTHHRLAEQDCNGYQDWRGNWDEAASLRAEKRTAEVEARITRLLAELPQPEGGAFAAQFSGDPRGATVKIDAPKALLDVSRGVGWGGLICVPTND